MRSILKKSLFVVLSCLLATNVWGQDPTLAINTESQGSTDFLGTYATEGIVLSSSVSFSSGAIQLGNTPSSYDQHYFEVLANAETIDSVSFLISGNGSNKNIQAPVFGWAETATSNTADTYRLLDEVTVTANSYAAAQWFTYDFSDSEVKCVRIYRSTKSISSVDPEYIGSSTALGSGQTIKIYGLKVWLAENAPADQPVSAVQITGPTESIVGADFTLKAKAIGGQATSFWWTEGNGTAHISDNNELTVTPTTGGTYVYKAWAQNSYNTAPVSATHTVVVTVASGEIIKATTQKVVSGVIGGTCQTNLSTGDTQKLNKSKYFGVTLAKGTFAENDTFAINITAGADLGKCMIYGDNAGTDLIYDEGIVYTKADATDPVICPTGLKKIVLPAAVNGKSSLYLYREDGNTQWNPTFSYIAVIRPEGEHEPVPLTGVSVDPDVLSIEQGKSATLTALFVPSNADNKNVTWTSSNTNVATVDASGKVTAVAIGTATITVTTEEGSHTATCAVTVTAPAPPTIVSATWTNIQGTATIDNDNQTVSGEVKHGTDMTAITVTFTGSTDIVSCTTEGTPDFSQGPVSYYITFSTGHALEYSVTITEGAYISDDATLKSMTYGSASVPNFRPDSFYYQVELPYGIKSPPQIDGEVNHPKATKVVTQAGSVPGSGNIRVTAEDGTTTKTYTLEYTTTAPTPVTPLTLHVPDIYQESETAGGYNTPLTVVNGREYEVYYINRDGDYLSVSTTNVDKAPAITTSSDKQNARATDGWFTIATSTNHGGDTNAGAKDEFKSSIRSISMKNEDELVFHVQGFDQFSFYGKDNATDKDKYFHVYIDDVLQTSPAPDNTYSIRRYNMTSGEHVIRIAIRKGVDSSSKFTGFSLRVAQEPRTKYLDGNDSTQEVLQMTAIKPIRYITKYNNIAGAQTRLLYIGKDAKGIGLQILPGTLCDTMVLSGNANCAIGEYHYAVVAYYNGKETNRVTGSFFVTSGIQATSDVKVEVYQNEEMDEVTFKYYALSPNDVRLTWTGTTPDGIFGSGNNGKYVIGGTPTTTGVYPYEITVLGADTVIRGQITVLELNYGENAVLYLYKNAMAYENDGVYQYLTSQNGGNHNIIARKAKANGLRPADQYLNYKWVIVSEDADADNTEVLSVIRGGSYLPVLNLKGFTYSPGRMNWGEPDNGAVDSAATKKQGCAIVVEQSTHPIFKYNINASDGRQMTILNTYASNGVMPIAITNAPGTLCLATGYTRNIDDYYGLGALQTAIHEVQADMRGGKKYICLPMGRVSQLSSNGEYLIKGIVEYLLSPDQTTILPPELEIRSFRVAGLPATINQQENTITLRLTEEEFETLDSLRAVKPEITVANPTTHVIPDGEVNLQYMYILPKTYVVTDYISRRAYDFIIDLYDPTLGIDEVYEAGQWVNIFDVYGRKVATTNEDIYTMELPHGMYIIVTENGQTLKIMR